MTSEQRSEVDDALVALPGVTKVVYISTDRALELYRLERQTKCEIWTGVNNYRSSMGHPAFFMLDARRRPN